MLWFFIVAFALFSVFLVPVFSFYKNGTEGEKELNELQS
jgi:hypothetical protein